MVEQLEDPTLLKRFRHPDDFHAFGYADSVAAFRQPRPRHERSSFADRMVDLDPEATRRDLPKLMAQTDTFVMAWTRLDRDFGFVFADQYVRQEVDGRCREALYSVLWPGTRPSGLARISKESLEGRDSGSRC